MAAATEPLLSANKDISMCGITFQLGTKLNVCGLMGLLMNYDLCLEQWNLVRGMSWVTGLSSPCGQNWESCSQRM